MGRMIAVLVPVLGRPHRIEPLIRSLQACSKVIRCHPYFLASPSDAEELSVLRHWCSYIGSQNQNDAFARYAFMDWEPEKSDYARKMNWGFANTREKFVFLGADDLTFHPGWAETAIATWYETGACVIGTNDLGNNRTFNGQHSTHSLIDRDYGECGTIDGDTLLHEGYWHNFVDDEFVQTARARGTFAHAAGARVEHLHPNWRKSHDDGTYRKGMAHWEEDRLYFKQREPLWKGAR